LTRILNDEIEVAAEARGGYSPTRFSSKPLRGASMPKRKRFCARSSPGGIVSMLSKALLDPILDNDALTRGLGDMEARMLVEWLVDEAERHSSDGDGHEAVRRLCRWARAVSRFVYLWCHAGEYGAACQLAAAERFAWPWPTTHVDPCELMEVILWHGDSQ
jgi:hypothetical protein